ncbi:MAG: bifunctional riboflavin kinase/FAD synthetase [Actinobacteria bacterium]|nr:bifunctional riboflavin kinase/FAD synthetase [Actinomycetota bacterium]
MKIINGLEQLEKFDRPTAVTMGVYDGVHLGHRSIIERCVERSAGIDGPSVVVTFEPIPLSVLDPARAPGRLTTKRQKERYISALGVDTLLVVHFDKRFAAMTAREFVEVVLSEKLNARVVVVGQDFRFGRDREGDLDFLTNYLSARGVEVEAAELLKVDDGTIISSTRIRELLGEGDIEAAAGLLGRYPAVEGVVEKGLNRGRRIGFATANLRVENEGAIPKCGVYAGLVLIGGVIHAAVINVGTSPTFGDVSQIEFHAHIIGFDGNIYGELIEVELRKRLRDELAFKSVGELRAEIKRDVNETMRLLGGWTGA